MLRLAADLRDARPGAFEVHVATVDHGLRPEAAAEAVYVAALAAERGLPHASLAWRGWRGAGNLQAEAREARYRLLASHAAAIGAGAVLAAHHADDQIETHRLALARGQGGAALAGMRPARDLAPGIRLLRPFLALPGARLREALRGSGWRPVEDSSNRDPRFARARLRAAPLDEGERAAILAAIARHADDRAAEDARLLAALREVRAEADELGRVRLDAGAFDVLPPALAARLAARVATAAGGARHGPERAAAERLSAHLRAGDGRAATLNGAQLRRSGGTVLAGREWGRAGPPDLAAAPGAARLLFDGRFDIELPPTARAGEGGVTVVAFGRLGRGSEAERTLPLLLDAAGRPRLVHPAAAAKAGTGPGPLDARCRVGWRLRADLGGEPEQAAPVEFG